MDSLLWDCRVGYVEKYQVLKDGRQVFRVFQEPANNFSAAASRLWNALTWEVMLPPPFFISSNPIFAENF